MEKILCSAILYNDIVISGRRHSDCYKTLTSLLPNLKDSELPDRDKQGFLTSKNRFVDRKEGCLIAKNNNQIFHKFDIDILTSEDLFGIDDEEYI